MLRHRQSECEFAHDDGVCFNLDRVEVRPLSPLRRLEAQRDHCQHFSVCKLCKHFNPMPR